MKGSCENSAGKRRCEISGEEIFNNVEGKGAVLGKTAVKDGGSLGKKWLGV